MCGFAGWVGERDDALLARMNRAQKHRGPDADGYYVDATDHVSLIACRLAIVDAAGGAQPMSDPTAGVTLVYAGELANAPELRAQLERRGHVFRSDHSDTEVVLRAYVEFGEAIVDHLNGMYAFVVHDRRRQRLFGAVDRFNIKPLYLAAKDRRFAFATELKSLLVLPWVDQQLDRQALYDALTFQCVPAPRSIFAGARKLGPAQAFAYDMRTQTLALRDYWSPRIADEATSGIDSSARDGVSIATTCRAAIDAALQRWSRSDGPIGMTLSGGIDSSALVALASLRTGANAPIKTYFTMLAGEPETPRVWARAVAEQYRTDHTEIVVQASDVARELDTIVRHLEEPYGGSIPSWFLFQRMARDVRVAITGLGADELFGNYGKWRNQPVPGDTSHGARVRQRAAALALRQQGRFADNYLSDAYVRQGLLSADFAATCVGAEPRHAALAAQAGSRDPRSIVPFVDWHLQLPHEFLHMTDRLSMAHGLEARPPFLDHQLVDLIWSLPPSQRSRLALPKGLLIDAVGAMLPPGLTRAPKHGFALPTARLLSGVLAERVAEMLAPRRLRQQGIFRDDLMTTLVAPHTAGRRELTQPLWSVFMLQLWHARFVDAGASST